MNPASTCHICRLIWCLAVFGATGYAVFWLGHSGWWFLFALFICYGDCKDYRSPEQIAASSDDEFGTVRRKEPTLR
jgi:hypothetical protein